MVLSNKDVVGEILGVDLIEWFEGMLVVIVLVVVVGVCMFWVYEVVVIWWVLEMVVLI